jgi:hypothetical protein
MRGFTARLAGGSATRGRALRWLPLAVLSAAVLLAAACAEPRSRDAGWTPGLLVVGRTEALAGVLASIQRLEPTPLARGAGALRRALPACAAIEAQSPSGAPFALREGLRCLTGDGAAGRLDRERGDDDLAFVWKPDDGSAVRGTLTTGPGGGLEVALRVPRSAFAGARALLRPGVAAAGPGVLSGEATLLHTRLRAEGGLPIAEWVSRGSQADRLFRLKSELFAGTVLDGTWELAVYAPGPASPMPPAALALGIAHRDAAVAAMEGFVRELLGAWPVHRSAMAVGEARGACLLDLNVLPELAPCYVATDRALVVGWNPASVRRALEGDPPAPVAEAAAATVDFERIADADAQLARRLSPDGRRRPLDYPWRRLVARGRRVGDEVRVRMTFVPGVGR